VRIERFEDVESWKEARLLVRDVYLPLQQCKDFGFRDQIQRATLSVMANIAEGFDRASNKEFVQFLVIARGSVSEVKSLAYAARDLSYIDEISMKRLLERCTLLGNLINGFIRYLRNTERKR
jgi:four helix bundle protein